MVFVYILVVMFGVLLFRFIASGYAHFVAFNITGSQTFPGSYTFEWDPKLQFILYLSYLILFIIAIAVTIAIKYYQSDTAKETNWLCITILVLIFPTFQNTVNCEVDLGGWCGDLDQMILPVILSKNFPAVLAIISIAFFTHVIMSLFSVKPSK